MSRLRVASAPGATVSVPGTRTPCTLSRTPSPMLITASRGRCSLSERAERETLGAAATRDTPCDGHCSVTCSFG